LPEWSSRSHQGVELVHQRRWATHEVGWRDLFGSIEAYDHLKPTIIGSASA
jgi:hypothetical protein